MQKEKKQCDRFYKRNIRTIENVINSLEAGVPIKAIAKKYGFTERQVKYIKQKYQVRCILEGKRPTKAELETAFFLKRLGLEDWYIAKMLGVKAKCLFNY